MSDKLYHIIPLSESNFLIVAKSWKRTDYILKQLAIELKSVTKVSGVVFDLLMKNGSTDRFFKADFNTSNASFSSFKSVSVNKEVKSKANDFFAKNPQLLSSSMLTPGQKFLFKKELAI